MTAIVSSDKEEIAWAAGLFEGEGSILMGTKKQPGWLAMGNSDEDVIRRFARVLGGNVSGPYAYQKKDMGPCKPMYYWRLYSICKAQKALQLMWPHLGERRRARAAEMIAGHFLRKELS